MSDIIHEAAYTKAAQRVSDAADALDVMLHVARQQRMNGLLLSLEQVQSVVWLLGAVANLDHPVLNVDGDCQYCTGGGCVWANGLLLAGVTLGGEPRD